MEYHEEWTIRRVILMQEILVFQEIVKIGNLCNLKGASQTNGMIHKKDASGKECRESRNDEVECVW